MRVPEQTSDALYPEPHALSGERFGVLDGWRALSILAVMAGHWLPLDRILPNTNEAVPAAGMAMFFTLSGFLITRFLVERPEATPFLIRRFLRIVPLAWAAVALLYVANMTSNGIMARLVANLLFFANLPPAKLFHGGEHLWSLCVEMQFYVGAALLVALGGRRGLFTLPLIGISITVARILAGENISIVTWHRADEILAGATLALIFLGHFGERPVRLLSRYPLWLAAIVAAICCYFLWTPLAYARPYAVAALIGATLFRCPAPINRVMTSRPAIYIAEISYALYVFHGMLSATWLGTGGVTEKYLKRPLLIATTFALAHLSTYHFERRFILLAKRLTRRRPIPTTAAAASPRDARA
jgi:peptidoglycan/LPS O-acetylase OafA/YrhL